MKPDSKQRWVIARENNHHSDETWQLQLRINKDVKWLEPEEIKIYDIGLLQYFTVDFVLSIHGAKGRCISGDLQYLDGRQKSTAYVLDQIAKCQDYHVPLFDDEITTRFLYVKQLYELTQGMMLSFEEFDIFKRMYHAVQRDDWNTVAYYLKGSEEFKKYKPNRILINNGKSA